MQIETTYNSIGTRIEARANGEGTLLFKYSDKKNNKHQVWSHPRYYFPTTDIVSVNPTVYSIVLGSFW